MIEAYHFLSNITHNIKYSILPEQILSIPIDTYSNTSYASYSRDGLENSLTNFLLKKSRDLNSEVYNKYSYDFLYFLGHKSHLTFDEIENLIQIFNFDMEDDDRKKVRKIVKKLSVIGKYSLKKDSQVIDVTAKIDLGTIWK